MKTSQVERNLKAIELEKAGEIEKAIALYEENITKVLKEIILMTDWQRSTKTKSISTMRFGF